MKGSAVAARLAVARDLRGMSTIYRHGRVPRHVSEGGRAVIDVEAPSHLVDRWRQGRSPRQEHPA